MRIRNNKSAGTALRSLTSSRTALSKSLEKLASGYAINRAGDDAAGLAISEKMRRQITALGRADKNSKEGIKLIQTGEGALDEIHDMLNRAAYLAEQSANGIYDDEIDRRALQDELDQLCADIGRIAESANFNGVKLFQDKGPEFEGESAYAAALKKAAGRPASGTARSAAESAHSSAPRTLDDLLEGHEKGDLNIVYFEDPINVTQTTGTASAGASNPSCDIDINGTKISEILKKAIVPQTVQNILTNYPAFSYLKDSAIGIGMRLYSDTSSSTLASVTLQSSLYPNGTGTLGYTLSVNVGKVDTSKVGWREDLEATIAHEMIHAFMDEAATAGMTGKLPGTGSLETVGRFESWFIEGMAQTASGPDNWVRSNGALKISETSTDAAIRTQISNHKLGASNDSAADYGTGYLACMYLGWAIASGGNSSTPVTAGNISMGLTSLMNAVIGGKSLDTAINELTGGKYASTSAFKTAFNSPDTEITGFIRNLMAARGTGRGGLASGSLSHTDLTSDTELPGIKLFELDTSASMITNTYPPDYVVLTGGTTSKDGVAPSDFSASATQTDYGDFVIKGNLPSDGSGGMQGITWDDTTKTLTVTTGNDIEISMKSPTTGVNGSIVLNGTGNVTLNGVKADRLTVSKDTQITYKAKNDIGTVTVDSGKNAVFQGEGQLKAGTFTNNGTVSFNGGAVIAGGGTGTIGGAVNIDKASVAADITSPTGPNGTTALKSINVDWSKLSGLDDIASISFDGTKSAVPLDKNEPGTLWLDPAQSHRITFTDSNGVSKTLAAKLNTTTDQLEWAEPIKPFTVTGGTEGTDYHYEDDGTTLVIDTDAVTSISGGNVTDESGAPLRGRVRITDGVGAVSLTLDGVDCSQNTVGSAFDLGVGNNVTLTLKDGTENKFTGKTGFAGISLGTGTDLTINGDTGSLSAAGGTDAAGIGRNAASSGNRGSDRTSDITINGGNITALGGNVTVSGNYSGSNRGAGIGAGNYNDIGNITITGGTITSIGGNYGGAGIGGANYASCGDIKIDESSGKTTITAISLGHGAGIGGGWYDTTNGDITISAGSITAESRTHGTGIGAGCQGSSSSKSHSGKITITGSAVIESAQGGDSSAGIGGSRMGSCDGVEISGNAVVKEARGGNNGAGIGSGDNSDIGTITINTTGIVNAYGGTNGVGIGSGPNGSSCSDIEIKQGTVTAKGGTNSTGIGAGRNSTSGNITIGDAGSPNNKVIVSAEGGMTYNSGNIMSYSDPDHKTAGTVTITGNGTSVRPGDAGEGLYSTSGTVDGDGNQRYAYPVYLFEVDGSNSNLDAGVGLNAVGGTTNLLPLDKTKVDPQSIQISSSTGDTWIKGLGHEPLDSDYVFVWLKPENQKLTISYEEDDGTGNKVPKSVDLDLIYYPDAGVFRIKEQPKPAPAQKPGYEGSDPVNPPQPEKPSGPANKGQGGIILQIGAEYGEILEVPQFYLSLDALKMGNLDISTQPNAWESMPVIKNAINRVSSIRSTYGALYNRLEHNQSQLQQEVENITEAESRIRDVDVAEEMMRYVKSNILVQSAQTMLAQANQLPQNTLQLLS